MSWPKAGVRLPNGDKRTCSVIGIDVPKEILHVQVQVATASNTFIYRTFEIPFDDVIYINTEAASAYGNHGMRVIGVGYGAAEKLDAYEKSK